MVSDQQRQWARQKAGEMLQHAGIVITEQEAAELEVTDFGLGELTWSGLQLVVYVNTDRYCAKELVVFPGQTCPEHRHPPLGPDPGKKETFRCRSGRVWLYVAGPPTAPMNARIPPGREPYYTVFHEITLEPGQQYTLEPDTPHWFQADSAGAIVSEFSSPNRDEADIFTDPQVNRVG